MYAIVDIAGQQFKVEKEQKLFVHRLPGDEESKVDFDNVLLIDNDGKITLGKPVIDGASVSAKILSHVKGDKVLVFKKKRRKGYKTLNGHRQLFTEIVIEKIQETGAKKAASPKAEAKPKAAPKAEAKTEASTEATAKAETAAPAEKKEKKEKAAAKPKAAAKKKPAAKKPAAKKTTKEDPKK